MTSSASWLQAVPVLRRRLEPGRANRRAHRHESRLAWLFVLPFLILFLTFTLIPVVAAVGFSFTDITFRDLRDPFGVDFVGFANLAAVLTNPEFVQAVGNTLVYAIAGGGGSLVAGFALALILNNLLGRLKTVFRAAFYLPVITNVVAAAVIWQYALSPSGTVNSLLESVGLDGVNWLGSSPSAIIAVISLGIWRNMGTAMVIFLAGLQSIPEELEEAASLDGAGPVRRFFHITLPLLLPTVLLVSILMTNFFVQLFDEAYVLTKGAPLGTTMSIGLWIFQQFGLGQTAVAFTGALILLVVATAINVAQFRLLRSRA